MTYGGLPVCDYYGDVNPACVLVWGHNPVVSGPDGEIQVSMQREPSGEAKFSFSGLGSKGTRAFPTEETKRIAASIGAEIQATDDLKSIHIRMAPIKEKSAR